MHVKKDDVPLVSAPSEELWVVFRDFESLGVVWVEALTADAVVQVASAATPDPLLLGAPTTLTFTQVGTRQMAQLPIGGTVTNKATRIKPTAGRIAVAFAAPSEFRHYIAKA